MRPKLKTLIREVRDTEFGEGELLAQVKRYKSERPERTDQPECVEKTLERLKLVGDVLREASVEPIQTTINLQSS